MAAREITMAELERLAEEEARACGLPPNKLSAKVKRKYREYIEARQKGAR